MTQPPADSFDDLVEWTRDRLTPSEPFTGAISAELTEFEGGCAPWLRALGHGRDVVDRRVRRSVLVPKRVLAVEVVRETRVSRRIGSGNLDEQRFSRLVAVFEHGVKRVNLIGLCFFVRPLDHFVNVLRA
jgi:hypothetical protein